MVARSSSQTWIAFVGMAVSALAAVPACVRHDTKTQITVALTSETKIPDELDGIEVVVTAPDGSEVSRVYTDVEDGRFFPQTLAIVPRDSASLDGAVKVEVSGYAAGKETQVFRRAIISYVEGRTLLLPMPLRMACFRHTACNATETCAGGDCQSATIETSALADFDESRVFDTAAGAHCFSESACLAGAKVLSINDDCTFALPAGAPVDGSGTPAVNVAIRWSAAMERIIALDEGDATEGFTLVAADGGTRVGKLSDGVCRAIQEAMGGDGAPVFDKAEDAWIAIGCAPKQPLQPYCRDAVTGQLGIGRALP